MALRAVGVGVDVAQLFTLRSASRMRIKKLNASELEFLPKSDHPACFVDVLVGRWGNRGCCRLVVPAR